MDDNKMDNDKIYRKLTINMQNKMAKFKEGRSTKDRLNDQLILNISSLCRFLRKKEEQKKKEEEERESRKAKKEILQKEIKRIHDLMLKQEVKDKEKNKAQTKKGGVRTKRLSEEMQKLKKEKSDVEEKIRLLDEEEANSQNQTILDVFVPYSRLTKSLQVKLESLNEEIQEEEDEENDISLDGEQPNLDNNIDENKLSNLIADEDADEQIGGDLNGNTDFLNDDLSISMSLYNKPIGFDEFKSASDSNIKVPKDKDKDFPIEKEPIKSAKSSDQIIPDVNKEEQLKKANEDFKTILKPKEIKEMVYEMSYDYIKYMNILYQKMLKKSNENINEANNQNKTLNFINQFKSFILDIGISDKKFYEQCIREIIYNKSESTFRKFLECFKKLVNSKLDQIFLKYKFLLNIVDREDDEYFTDEELDKYYNLINNSKKPNENEIQEEIRSKLITKYKKIFSKNEKINARKLSLVLEQFFDIK